MAPVERRQPPAVIVAVVGYAARFPGAASADEFWDALRDGRDAISDVPADRVLTKLAAQHKQQCKTKSIADSRYEFRWVKIKRGGSRRPQRAGHPAAHR